MLAGRPQEDEPWPAPAATDIHRVNARSQEYFHDTVRYLSMMPRTEDSRRGTSSGGDDPSYGAVAWMFAGFLVWVALCFLAIPSVFGDTIRARLGSPFFIFAVSFVVYAIAPSLVSLSAKGRALWDVIGRGFSARFSALAALTLGLLCAVAGFLTRPPGP